MLRLIQLLAITAVAILVSAESEACTMYARWTLPTTRIDMVTPFAAREVAGYELRYVGVNVSASGFKRPKVGTVGYALTGLKPGTYSATIRLKDVTGVWSVWSPPAVGACTDVVI